MDKVITFVSAKEAVNNFLSNEFESFPKKLNSQFLNFFSELSTYEEEGRKLRPNILFTKLLKMFCNYKI